MSSFFRPGSSALTSNVSLSSYTSTAGNRPCGSCDPCPSSGFAFTKCPKARLNKLSTSSRRLVIRRSGERPQKSGRCHLVNVIIHPFSCFKVREHAAHLFYYLRFINSVTHAKKLGYT